MAKNVTREGTARRNVHNEEQNGMLAVVSDDIVQSINETFVKCNTP
jgi:hypothetical protein